MFVSNIKKVINYVVENSKIYNHLGNIGLKEE